jgi:23S rRNA (adenine2503-C2)-methyltransferase
VAELRPITDLDDSGLAELISSLGGRRFQANQLAHWIYKHGATEYAACKNLPASLRSALSDRGPLLQTRVRESEESGDGTRKLLIELSDGETVETVLIPEGNRSTLCISTQVGCPVACVFCASGLAGVRRNLRTGEIVEQFLHGLRASPRRGITNLVVMGIGEPMLNLSNLMAALERIHDPAGIDLGARRITVSTSGYPRQIEAFAAAPHPFGLAISLHAADESLRRRLVPNSTAPVREIVAAGRRCAESRGREVTFEVVLLAGLNDGTRHARDMADLLAGIPCTVNLIPWNPVAEIRDLGRPSPERVANFADHLRRGGMNVTVRKQRGADRSAACGQLRIRGVGRGQERESDGTELPGP